MSSPTQSTEVPDEAVEAAAQVRRGPNWKGLVRGKETPSREQAKLEKKAEEERVLAEIRAELRAAAPFIRNQEHQRLKEALEEKWPKHASDEFKNGFDDALKCLEAAFQDNLDPSGEQGEEELPQQLRAMAESLTGCGREEAQALVNEFIASQAATDPSKEEQLLERAEESYVQSPLATQVIKQLKTRENEAKEKLDRLTKQREFVGVERSAPATPTQLVAYTEKRIYRDAILTVSDTDLELHVFADAPPRASSEEVGGDGE